MSGKRNFYSVQGLYDGEHDVPCIIENTKAVKTLASQLFIVDPTEDVPSLVIGGLDMFEIDETKWNELVSLVKFQPYVSLIQYRQPNDEGFRKVRAEHIVYNKIIVASHYINDGGNDIYRTIDPYLFESSRDVYH